MSRVLIPVLILLALSIGIYGAHAFGLGEGNRFGRSGVIGKGKALPQATGKILLVDGASFILQTDAASKVCRAGGC